MEKDIFAPHIGHLPIQTRIITSLRHNRLPHAFLFHGPEGCGKDAFAIAVAQLLNCQSGKEQVCGECSPCRKIANLQHPDVKFIFPTPAKSNVKDEDLIAALEEKAANPYRSPSFAGKNIFIGIDTVRELKQEARFKLYEGEKKVFIISRAESMRPEAANALLKLLEEPPSNLLLILTTSQIHKILPTIKSRCQLIRFLPLSEAEIAGIVQRYVPSVDSRRLPLYIRLAGFNVKQVFDFLEDDVLEKRDLAVELLRKAVTIRRSQELMELAEKIAGRRDRENLRQVLWFLLLWFQDILHLRENPDTEVVNMDLRDNLINFINFVPHVDVQAVVWEIENALQALEDLRNFNPLLILTTLAIKLNRLMKK